MSETWYREDREQERRDRMITEANSLEHLKTREMRARERGPMSSPKDSSDPKHDRQLPSEDEGLFFVTFRD